MEEGESDRIQLSFITKDKRYSVSSHPIYVQLDSDRRDLSELVKNLLDRDDDESLEFEFLIQDELLVGSLKQLVEENSVGLDSIVESEFFPRRSPPKPHSELQLNDFVSCVRVADGRILISLYDRSVQAAKIGDEARLFNIAGAHEKEAKCVDWLSGCGQRIWKFVSGGHDQDCRLWSWDSQDNRVECTAVCKGHEDSVLCVCSNGRGQFASGSFDGQVKLWSPDADMSAETGGIQHKRRSDSKQPPTRLPCATLGSHRDCVHCLAYCSEDRLYSGSGDAALRQWDCSTGAEIACMRASGALLSLHCRADSQLVLAGCAATQPRLYDPLSQSDVLTACFTGHNSWVSAVRWCPYDDRLFVSGGYDCVIKVWDIRCVRAPLYDIRDHSGIVTSVDWSPTGHIVSASADRSVKIFDAKLGARVTE